MAYQFLKSLQSPQYVSKICISKNETHSVKNSQNCTIQSVSIEKNKVSFQVKENALPFPTVSNQEKSLQLVPFTEELNVELLQVSGLKKGNFSLTIDGISVGTFSSEQLNKGINLANHQSTPQYQQALKVREMLEKLWVAETSLRGIKFIEFNPYYKDCPNKEKLKTVETYLDSVFTVKYTNPYFKSRLMAYLKDKPLEDDFNLESDQYRAEAYRLAQPKYHNYVIVPK